MAQQLRDSAKLPASPVGAPPAYGSMSHEAPSYYPSTPLAPYTTSRHHHQDHPHPGEHAFGSYGYSDDYGCGYPVDHRPILAERFKTKMCRNYEQTGVCPYVHRCMFAHGEHELRNKAMNLADGLTTEEAIKAFKRANYEAVRFGRFYGYGSDAGSPMPMSAYAPSTGGSRSTSPTPPPSPLPAVHHLRSGSWRHDPYAQYCEWHRPVMAARPSSAQSAVCVSPLTGSHCAAPGAR